MATRTCPDCGHEVSVWAKACMTCGRPTPGNGPLAQLLGVVLGPVIFLVLLGGVLFVLGFGR